MREHTPLVAVMGGYLLITLAADAVLPPWGHFPTLLLIQIWVLFGIAFALIRFITYGAQVMAALRAGERPPVALGSLAHGVLSSIAVMALLLPFMAAFTRWKVAINNWRPFAWDEVLMRLDRALHFGHHPWELAARIVSTPELTVLLDRVYMTGWFLTIYAVIAWQAWSRERELRLQFFLTWAAMWIFLGNVLAFVFSSAGPTFYALFVDRATDPFAPLLEYLQRVDQTTPLICMWARETLLRDYINGGIGLGVGISAMPSLHLAVATLFVLRSWHSSRLLAGYFVLFTLVILIGSVHFGWHYAVDGYLSIALVPLLWWASGRFVRWYGERAGAFQ